MDSVHSEGVRAGGYFVSKQARSIWPFLAFYDLTIPEFYREKYDEPFPVSESRGEELEM